jgi:hypothetical protein
MYLFKIFLFYLKNREFESLGVTTEAAGDGAELGLGLFVPGGNAGRPECLYCVSLTRDGCDTFSVYNETSPRKQFILEVHQNIVLIALLGDFNLSKLEALHQVRALLRQSFEQNFLVKRFGLFSNVLLGEMA